MAPKASAAAEQVDHSCPILKLIMEKGPLSGQALDFRPGSRIRVGRVVRGNTLSIKDAGISSQHLLIQTESISDLGRLHWTITDLGSSNGTVLNGCQIQTSVPATLSDGDVVKIGETTAIKVKFEVNEGEGEGEGEGKSGNARRYVKRRGKDKGPELGVIDENSELGLDGNDLGIRYNLRGNVANEKVRIVGNEGGKLGAECEGKVSGRRTRGSKPRDLGNVGEEVEGKIKSLGNFSPRRTKSSIKEENLEMLATNIHDNEGKSDNVSEIEGKGGKNAHVRTRSSRKDESLVDEFKGVLSVGGQRVSSRRTRSSRKEENLLETVTDFGITKGKRTRKGTRGRSSLREGTSLEDKTEKESNLEHKNHHEEENGKFEAAVDEVVEEGINSGSEGVAGFASTSGVVRNEEPVADLEKMTLGEWLDYLEVYLPKQIIDTTEEMISGMREKAEKLHEFMLEQKNA